MAINRKDRHDSGDTDVEYYKRMYYKGSWNRFYYYYSLHIYRDTLIIYTLYIQDTHRYIFKVSLYLTFFNISLVYYE